MQDLNDLYYFARVVEHGGFAAAARALGMQKSKLSRRIAALEERLGVRLVQRSTRRFSVTEIGQDYYRHCMAVLVEAEAAQAAIDNVRAGPQGIIHMACPPALLAYRFGASIGHFLALHPAVEIHLKAVNRPVDVIGEGFDIAICTPTGQPDRTTLMSRKLGEVSYCLVASPALLAKHGEPSSPADLATLPSVAFVPDDDRAGTHQWNLIGDDGAEATVPHHPRLLTDDVSALRSAALQGIGVAQLPSLMVQTDLAEAKLSEVLPHWRPRNLAVHAIFPTRRGLLPSIRALLDFLSRECVPYRHGTPANAAQPDANLPSLSR